MAEEIKICTKCKRELPLSMFRWKNKIENKKHSQCKDCEKERDRIHYRESKERRESILENSKFQKNRNLELVNQYKEKGCQKCGESRFYVLDFHHIDPNNKINDIAHMIKSSSEFSLRKELEKCVLLCANCHREFHFFQKEKNISIQEYLRN